MKAFVKTNNKTFPNINFFTAWEGFNAMGYDVICFEEKDIPRLDITKDTPVFAGVTIFRKIIDQLGINYPPFNCYPDVLSPYYGRNIQKSTLGEERRKFNDNPKLVFIKPILPKQFTGTVLSSILELIPISNVPDDTLVWACEPIHILSEFRCYVDEGYIIAVKHYYGDWSITPDRNVVEEIVRNYKPCPASYGIDFGVVKLNDGSHRTIVVEVNDGCNLGNYGIDSIHYAEMIVSRWTEIVS